MLRSFKPHQFSMAHLTVLGSTGSIGTNTLDVVRQNSHRFEVYGLAAGRNVDLLATQIQEFRPRAVTLPGAQERDQLLQRLSKSRMAKSEWPDVTYGPEALVAIATAGEVDAVISAILGVAGPGSPQPNRRSGER